MTTGYVIFANEQAFDNALALEDAANGFPVKGTHHVTECIPHPDAQDDRVVAYINGGWRESTKSGFTFVTVSFLESEGWKPAE